MKNTKWKKVYKGPFETKEDAQKLVDDIKFSIKMSDSKLIQDAKIRIRRSSKHCVCTCSCGAGLGHNIKYDVYIKIHKDIF